MKNSNQSTLIHDDLIKAKEMLYERCHFNFSNLHVETEGREYGACSFAINDLNIIFRVAKITPTKIGQFVTLWKRINNGPTQPYSADDNLDFMIISVRNDDHFGQFIFPKATLIEKGIVEINGKGGKRGIRVYPPWDIAQNTQAKKTQQWQLNYFVDINDKSATEQCQSLFKQGFHN